jgi:RNA polymerase sigma-70 factor, ECF subfamily
MKPIGRRPDMTDWAHIVRVHGPAVWRTAYRLLNHEADAGDCFQRTFVSALAVADKESIRNWPALLKRLTTARALERLRQRRREANRRDALPEGGGADARAADPVQAAEAGELASHLREALAELDARQSEVFCLSCLEGLSYTQIAEQVGVTVNHVGVLLNRARSRLRELLIAHSPAAQNTSERKGNHE